MAKPNYAEKRQRELAKKAKKEEGAREGARKSGAPAAGRGRRWRPGRRRRRGHAQPAQPSRIEFLAARLARETRLDRRRPSGSRPPVPVRRSPRPPAGAPQHRHHDAARAERGEHEQPLVARQQARLVGRAPPAADASGTAPISGRRSSAVQRQPTQPCRAEASSSDDELSRRDSLARFSSWSPRRTEASRSPRCAVARTPHGRPPVAARSRHRRAAAPAGASRRQARSTPGRAWAAPAIPWRRSPRAGAASPALASTTVGARAITPPLPSSRHQSSPSRCRPCTQYCRATGRHGAAAQQPAREPRGEIHPPPLKNQAGSRSKPGARRRSLGRAPARIRAAGPGTPGARASAARSRSVRYSEPQQAVDRAGHAIPARSPPTAQANAAASKPACVRAVVRRDDAVEDAARVARAFAGRFGVAVEQRAVPALLGERHARRSRPCRRRR